MAAAPRLRFEWSGPALARRGRPASQFCQAPSFSIRSLAALPSAVCSAIQGAGLFGGTGRAACSAAEPGGADYSGKLRASSAAWRSARARRLHRADGGQVRIDPDVAVRVAQSEGYYFQAASRARNRLVLSTTPAAASAIVFQRRPGLIRLTRKTKSEIDLPGMPAKPRERLGLGTFHGARNTGISQFKASAARTSSRMLPEPGSSTTISVQGLQPRQACAPQSILQTVERCRARAEDFKGFFEDFHKAGAPIQSLTSGPVVRAEARRRLAGRAMLTGGIDINDVVIHRANCSNGSKIRKRRRLSRNITCAGAMISNSTPGIG